MSGAITSNRREKRKASGKGASLLIDLEGDFLDIEKNFKPESRSPLINEAKAEASSISNWPKEDSEVDQKQVKSRLKVGQAGDHKVGQKQVRSELKVGQENQLNSEHKHESRLKVGQQVGQSFNHKQVKSGLKVGQNQDISQVIGLQKNLLNFIFNNCVNNGSKESPYYSAGHLAHYLEVSNDSIKSAIRQLRIKGLLEKTNFKDGRGGGTKFLIPDLIYRDLLSESRLKVEQKQVISGLKVGLEVGQQVGQSLPSSSSFNITTTNYKADALAKIELTESLTLLGFNQGHIEQLLRDSSLTPDEIQQTVSSSTIAAKYNEVIDRESAFEILNKKLQDAAKEEEEEKEEEKPEKKSKKEEKSTLEKISDNTMVRQVGRTVFKEVARGLLGVLGLKKKKKGWF